MVKDCGCWDTLCGCCCCKDEGCLCGFGQRSKCVKFCCLPFTLVLLGVVAFFGIPRSVDVVLAEDTWKASYNPKSAIYNPMGNSMEFDFLNREMTMKTNIPVNMTNWNWVYKVSVQAKVSLYYPGNLLDPVNDAVYLGGAEDSVSAPPRGQEVLGDSRYNADGEPTWKNTQDWFFAYFKLKASATQWLQIINSLEADCGACKDPNHECIETTPFFMHAELTPDEERMSIMHKFVGTIIMEEVEELGCENIYSAGVLGL
ncbi:hypothetical protein TL16_g04164 [Triparma laevis f. inornata]|uniref:Uncharacterized protein n=1 Tax=Triparma laevis f. inornata TaxID=1714386 RepID=A0A9W7A865_9STRA|nr:hypothetical protein TL16_g04164 [Triparma laevis f. inornata]